MRRIFVSIGLAILLSSCATIINGTDPTILSTTSNPSGAKVTVRGLQNGEILSGNTPQSFSLSKGSDYQFVFDLDGYQSQEVLVRRSVNGWFWGNLLAGGIVGWIIDYSTNAMWDHDRAIINIDFSQAQIYDGYMVADMVIQYYQDGLPMHVKIPVLFNDL